jgi:hypothetical protein
MRKLMPAADTGQDSRYLTIVASTRYSHTAVNKTEHLQNNRTLVLIKLVHTLIWVFFNVVIFYLLYAVIAGRIDRWVWICIGLIAAEGLVLVVFKNACPVTLVARRYSASERDNFDIYLPNWLARHNKLIYSLIVLAAVIVLIARLIN